jgi:hypothetical protein
MRRFFLALLMGITLMIFGTFPAWAQSSWQPYGYCPPCRCWLPQGSACSSRSNGLLQPPPRPGAFVPQNPPTYQPNQLPSYFGSASTDPAPVEPTEPSPADQDSEPTTPYQ